MIIAGGVAVAVLTLIISYLLGRRVGRSKSAVIEVRRF
jgi:membrane protein DedA with SNARE-associated domain